MESGGTQWNPMKSSRTQLNQVEPSGVQGKTVEYPRPVFLGISGFVVNQI